MDPQPKGVDELEMEASGHARERPSKLTPAAANPISPRTGSVGMAPVAVTTPLAFAKRKRIRKKTPRELADDAVRLAQDSRLYNLTLDVNDLRQQVHVLTMQRHFLQSKRLLTRGAPIGSSPMLIRHYFSTYRHGLDMTKREHSDFMGACMDVDMHLGVTRFGMDMFVEQWRLHTQLFQIQLIDLVTLEVMSSDDESCVVRCVINNHGRLSRQTIAAVFPSALADESLVAKLIGEKIVTSAEMVFYVNSAQKISRLDVDVDMTDAFGRILKYNPQDVVSLMGTAVIAEESIISGLERMAIVDTGGVASADKQRDAVGTKPEELRSPSPSSNDPREQFAFYLQTAERDDERDGGQERNHHSMQFILS